MSRSTWAVVTAAALGACLVAGGAGCSRNAIEAVNLANEGDQVVASNLEEAISKYEQGAQLDPTNHRILDKLGRAYKKKEDWAKMASTYAKAEKVGPTFATYNFWQGYALRRAAEKGPTSWADAKEPLQEAIKKDPNLADAYHELGEVLLHLDDEAGALAQYTKAIDAKPDEMAFYGPLVDLYVRLGFLEQAEQVAREALAQAKPNDKNLFAVHSLLGQVYELRRNAAGAVTEYEAARALCGPCNDTPKGEQIAFFNLGSAYAATGKKNEAISQLSTFSKMVCKGGLQQRYQDQCAQAQEIARRLGGNLP